MLNTNPMLINMQRNLKVQTEYNVKTNENIGNSNNKYIRDMLKDSSLRRVNKPVVRNIRRYTR